MLFASQDTVDADEDDLVDFPSRAAAWMTNAVIIGTSMTEGEEDGVDVCRYA